MATLAETLTPLFDAAVVGRMSRQLGVDEQTTRQGIQVALPLIISALARNTSSSPGAQALSDALARDHDGSVLNHLPDAVAGYQAGPGDGILRHVFGQQRQGIETTLSQRTGVDAGAMLQMLAPVVLGALGSMQREQGLDAGGLATTLQHEQQQVGQGSPDVLAAITTLLDTNRDGSAVDDVIGLAGKFFGRRA